MERSMKINYISTYSIPSKRAVGIQIMNTCSALAEDGNDVTLWIPKQDKDFEQSEAFRFYNVLQNFSIKHVLIKRFGQGKIQYLLKTLLYLRNVKRVLKNTPSIIYSREQVTGLFFPGFVFEVHYLPRRVTFFHKLLWGRASRFVVVTSFLKEELIKSGFSAEKIHVAPDAVNDVHLLSVITKQDARKNLNLLQDKKIIAYVGKYETPFSGGKGVDELIQAFSEVIRAVPAAFILLVGIDTRYMEEVEKKITKAGIKGSYKISAHVSQMSVVEYLRAADVLVMNYPWSEHAAYQMSPMKLFEYMAAQRPIVASRLPSIEEVVDDSCVCFVEPDNQDDLIRGIIKTISDEEYAKTLSQASFERVQSYTWKKRAQGIHSFIAAV